MTSRRNSGGNGLGTMLILPARPQPHRQGVNSTGGSPFPHLSVLLWDPVEVGGTQALTAQTQGALHPRHMRAPIVSGDMCKRHRHRLDVALLKQSFETRKGVSRTAAAPGATEGTGWATSVGATQGAGWAASSIGTADPSSGTASAPWATHGASRAASL